MMSGVTCERYGSISEHESGEQIPICGGNNRIESIYMSKTSTLDIAIRSSDEYRFLLKYEGNNMTLKVQAMILHYSCLGV